MNGNIKSPEMIPNSPLKSVVSPVNMSPGIQNPHWERRDSFHSLPGEIPVNVEMRNLAPTNKEKPLVTKGCIPFGLIRFILKGPNQK